MELFEFPNDSPMAHLSGGVTVTPLSSSVLIPTGDGMCLGVSNGTDCHECHMQQKMSCGQLEVIFRCDHLGRFPGSLARAEF